MGKIDWDYARKADHWTLEEFSEFVCPDDPSAQAKLDLLVRRATGAWKQVVRRDVRFLGGTPEWKKYIIYVTPAGALAWAQGKGFIIPPELAGMASPRGTPDETQPSAAPDNEPIAKRKAPDIFVAALIRLLVEISKRAAKNGKPFDVNEMPGTKADFSELAIAFDGRRFNKAPSTFSDYLAGLLQFKEGAQKTTFYREIFPELFT